MPDAGVRGEIVGPLQLAGADAEAREAVVEPKPWRVGPDVHLGDQLVPLDGLDHRPGGSGEALAAFGDDVAYRRRVEPRGGHCLLDFDHGLEQLGIEQHRLFGQLPLGDVEFGAEEPDLPAVLVPQRLPGAGGPAHLPGAVHDPVLLVAERAALGQPFPLGYEGGAVVGMDVLQELLVADVFQRVAGETLEGRIGEDELVLQVIRDDALSHRRGDRLQLAFGLPYRALGLPPPAHLR